MCNAGVMRADSEGVEQDRKGEFWRARKRQAGRRVAFRHGAANACREHSVLRHTASDLAEHAPRCTEATYGGGTLERHCV
ncbi:unnamed protein product [Chondrus crispus]|uniref:Uncharacterized protein n=1 Tax=Chondrus crispus TaxID=2769 RepID=R7QQB7_CHOCR|nr:unnamed protein product [Chondrus crispus]CDF40692.1 unnamed protein product [Chondrus crispus]|eukprot:XP_005710986.1 unnamed protein product [Chondrus crispus]